MIVTLIAAVAQNGVIGKDNQLPWTIKDDMRFFVRTTKGHTVITGRKNFEAMGRALPHRRNIVVTR
jgi:dihydrofolate reductase